MNNEIQLVVFKLLEKDYGIDIHNVKEIGPYKKPVGLPDTPDYFEGIINLRGEIIPVVCLKKKFGILGASHDDRKRIIVTSVNNLQIGFIVDEASEVLTIPVDNVNTSIEAFQGSLSKYVKGIAKIDSRMLVLLSAEEIATELSAS